MRQIYSHAVMALCLCAAPAAADIYAFVSEDGVVHFANHPIDRRYRLIARESSAARDVAVAPQAPNGVQAAEAVMTWRASRAARGLQEPAAIEQPRRAEAEQPLRSPAPEPPRQCVERHANDIKRCQQAPADDAAGGCEAKAEEEYLRCTAEAER